MADKRINALTTTSASVGDDYFAIDGATNGTRALSAFSPTFGGNATVTGTLTVNSTSPSGFSGTVQANAFHVPGNGASKPANTDSYLASTATTSIPLYVSGFTGGGQSADILRVSLNSSSDWFAVKGNGQVTCLATTASTTTTSGALVVSGGLGLAGNLNMGGSLSVAGSSGISVDTTGSASLRFNDGASTKWWIYKLSGDTNLYYRDMVNSRMQMVMLPGADSQIATTALYSKFSVDATTASTSTSSGALVVSGGVGVGGQINAAGAVSSIPSSAANGTEYVGLSAQIGSDATLSSCRVTIGALPSATAASRYGFITCFDNGDWRRLYIGGSPGVAPNGGQVLIPATLSSTTTSSGALVVSGGVGVAGAIVAGSFIRSAGANNISLGADAGKNRIDAGGATDTPVRALGTADALTGIEMRLLGVIDGTSAPAATAGYAKLYVDSADGDLKVIFGDGTVKTIATDS